MISVLHPNRIVKVGLSLTGSKSITNRLLILRSIYPSLKIKNKGNENVTTSTTIWSLIFLLPLSLLLEEPWLSTPTLESTLSLLYLGIVATGLAWLIRFRILSTNGLVFQTQVAYLIPIFGVFFGYFLMNEVITWRVLISLGIIILGIFIVKKNNKGLKNINAK